MIPEPKPQAGRPSVVVVNRTSVGYEIVRVVSVGSIFYTPITKKEAKELLVALARALVEDME